MIYRIDVRTNPLPRDGHAAVDPVGEALRQQIAEFGAAVGPIDTTRIFLIDSDASQADVQRIANELLADPIVESAEVLSPSSLFAALWRSVAPSLSPISLIEIHLKPGVMDPVASSTEMAIRDMGLAVKEVRTGRAYHIHSHVAREELARIAGRVLANGVIESIHFEPFIPEKFAAGQDYQFHLKHIRLRGLSDEQLTRLSRDGHLFLSLAEMKAIQKYFTEQDREPSDIELETVAQTWSEHCVHKTLKSAVDVEVRDESGKVTSTRHYDNLIKETIFKSTMELMGRSDGATERRSDEGKIQDAVSSAESSSSSPPTSLRGFVAPSLSPDFCLSVFADNAGVIAFDETDAVCFKVETHNHPSAIEPYGGSATGIGGVIRDILGTGLGAKPIANTNVFCVAYPFSLSDEATKRRSDEGKMQDAISTAESSASPPSSLRRSVASSLPHGIIHPKRILQQVVAGVRDYGNRMGIPTVNGAVYFDNRYLGNPLVFCGCVGLIPCSQIAKEAMPGDAIVVMGGRTGRDGIHGATFSSAELTDTHADEFSHAVQIGNAITEKKMADVILQARDRGLFTAVTDCGAGGLSSAVGEMGEKIGARVELDKVPLKYAGLRYDEIWISEAQERMVLSVPQDKVAELLALSAGEDVESTVIGQFGTDDAQLILLFGETEVGRIAMHFLHHGIPKPKRKAVVQSAKCKVQSAEGEMLNAECGMMNAELKTQNAEQRTADNGQRTTDTIQHSAFSIQHSSPSLRTRLLSLLSDPNIASKHWIIRQYDHEVQGGSVIKPLIGPLQIGPSDAAVIRPKLDSYRGIAIGCGMAPHIADPYDMAIASIDEAIRNVVAVGADPARIAILDNFCWPSVDDEQTMGTLVRACEACYDAAKAYGIPFISGKDSLHNQFTNHETGEVLRIPNTLLISAIAVLEDVRKCITMDMKEEWERLVLVRPQGTTLADLARAHRAVAALIAAGLVRACHDVSDGGILVAIAEMSIASGFGATLPLSTLPAGIDPFAELLGAYILSVHRRDVKDVLDRAAGQAEVKIIGDGSPAPQFNAYTRKDSCELSIEDLTRAWRGTLDW